MKMFYEKDADVNLIKSKKVLGTSSRSSDYAQALMELGALICKPNNPLCEKCPISRADVEEAKQVLQEGFRFVGLQERWDESIMAFHGIFGGGLYEEELATRRANSRDKIKIVSELGVRLYANDSADDQLYAFASTMFEYQLKRVARKIPNWNELPDLNND